MATGSGVVFKKKKSDLKKLVLLMNRQNKRFFPPVAPLLEVLDLVLTQEELDLLLLLKTGLYTYEQAASASRMHDDGFRPLFESLMQKGFMGIIPGGAGEESYRLNPFVVGWMEAQVPYLMGRPEEKEFARRYMGLLEYLRDYNFFPARNLVNLFARLSPVSNQSVGIVREEKNAKGKSIISIDETVRVSDSKIYPANSVNDLIMEYGTKSIIGQLPCMCRRIAANVDDPCRLDMPDDGGCMAFGDKIKPYIKMGHARQISREEAFDIIQRVRDKGAVHTVFHEYDDANLPQVGLCNCCWDCCGIFRTYNMGSSPLRYACYYRASIKDLSKCTGCGKCGKYCPTAAISVVDKKLTIDGKRCIGCGQCAHQCAFSVVELVEDRRTAFLPMLKKSEARLKA
jgi:Pyruvate/2-oxoacid:ferredoxin oxidoreductase delta subunit